MSRWFGTVFEIEPVIILKQFINKIIQFNSRIILPSTLASPRKGQWHEVLKQRRELLVTDSRTVDSIERLCRD